MDFTILIVDDEPQMLNILRAVLTARGYKVVTAANGREALSIMENTWEPIHLLISDLKMPEIGGLEISHEIRRGRPNIPIILMTGGHPSEEDDIPPGAVALSKPFDLPKMVQIVKSLLPG